MLYEVITIRAADANIDDVADAFAGMPQPGATTHLLSKVTHLLKDRLHLRDDIFAIDQDDCLV